MTLKGFYVRTDAGDSAATNEFLTNAAPDKFGVHWNVAAIAATRTIPTAEIKLARIEGLT